LIRLVPQSLYIKITGHQQKKKIGRWVKCSSFLLK
jgi:hypothetical protein